MMIKPGITQLSRYVDSRYTLVTMVAKRARMIGTERSKAETYDAKADKPVTVAVNEIAKGKVGYVRSETMRKVKELEAEKAAAIISLNESDVKSLDELVKEAQAAQEEANMKEASEQTEALNEQTEEASEEASEETSEETVEEEAQEETSEEIEPAADDSQQPEAQA